MEGAGAPPTHLGLLDRRGAALLGVGGGVGPLLRRVCLLLLSVLVHDEIPLLLEGVQPRLESRGHCADAEPLCD